MNDNEIITNLIVTQQTQARVNERLVTSLARLRRSYRTLACRVNELEGVIAYLTLDEDLKSCPTEAWNRSTNGTRRG